MPPDLNSLSPQSSSPRPMSMAINLPRRESSSSPRPSTHSLAAAASINATERRSSGSRGSPRLDRTTSERRRSQVAMNINLNDPTMPAPGELSSSDRRLSMGNTYSTATPANIGSRSSISTGDPNHNRQSSLGDIHNELEQEQEAQVNRMLSLIRAQQQQLDTLRAQQSSQLTPHATMTSAVEDSTPQSERSFSFPSVHPAVGSIPRPSGRLSRENSNPNRSPALRPLPSQDLHESWASSPTDSLRRNSSSRRNSFRDETAYYQAEQANLQRENQMLRMRIRDLERLVLEKQHGAPSTPVQHSNLVTSPPLEAQDKG